MIDRITNQFADQAPISVHEPAKARTVGIAVATSAAFWLAVAGFLYADGHFAPASDIAVAPPVQTDG